VRGHPTPSRGLFSVARVTGCGASLEGDQVCAAMERAMTQQPADRGGINVVGASDISLRLATGQPPQCFLCGSAPFIHRLTVEVS
jgi:hypothetical protein